MKKLVTFSLFEASLQNNSDRVSPGGWILLLGKPDKDDNCNLFAAQIKTVKPFDKETGLDGNNRTTYYVGLNSDNYYRIREYGNTNIPMFQGNNIGGGDNVLEVLGLSKNGIVLNSKNKTPFWWVTSRYKNLNILLRECAYLIKEIPDKYPCVIDKVNI
jgi:hypothetical protein